MTLGSGFRRNDAHGEAFAKAFQCKSGDAMVRDGEKQVKIW
ncbi:MAG: hypothetical protein ABI227_03140 [Rhodanobacter sp.]